MGYSLGHCFPAGVHITQYPGNLSVWSDKVTNGQVGTAGTVVGCMNVVDAAACLVDITTNAAGWANVGVWNVASASLAWASQFHWKNAGRYPIFIFLSFDSFSILYLLTTLLLLTGVSLGLFANGEGLCLEG